MASTLLQCQQPFLSCTSFQRGNPLKKHRLHHRRGANAPSTSRNFRCENKRTSSFRHRSSAEFLLRELPEASFDQYMENKGRVIQAIFPGKSKGQQLTEEVWRVKMTPIRALFLTCQPVIYITASCTSDGENYPPEIPRHVTKLLEVHITKWELQDLHVDYIPLDFNIKSRGAIYLERQGKHSWIKNQLDFSLSLAFPPLLAWVPEYVLHNIVQTVLKNYVEDINNGFAVRLLEDYNSYKRNKSKNSV
ncbi:hypothetical protein RIF29_19069 [Crotalaria pallida]|uniref:Uncharacterized protein n=1 Tax=Crotalaria pallida TaxID=3830 RepID=A0AAN9I7F1_CROPI